MKNSNKKQSCEIEKIRSQIDETDKNLILLFEKRIELVKKIWQLKKEKNLPLLDPEREKQMLESVLKLNFSEISKTEAEHFYRLILSETKKILPK